jgi:hypothetical protein
MKTDAILEIPLLLMLLVTHKKTVCFPFYCENLLIMLMQSTDMITKVIHNLKRLID